MQREVAPVGARAVSLDLWGTLIRSHPAFKPARTRLLGEAFGIDAARDAAADLAFRGADRAADVTAERTGEDVGFAARIAAFHAAAAEAGLAGREMPDAASLLALEAAQDALVRRFPPQPFTPGVTDLLLRLGRAVPVAVGSNTGMLGGATMRTALAAAGMLPAFRVLLFSEELGAAKPSERFFSATHGALSALTRGGLSREDVVHVGDNLVADVDGARACGLGAVHVNAPGAPGIEAVLEALLREPTPAAPVAAAAVVGADAAR